MSVIVKTPNYNIAKVIFSKKGTFTIDEIIDDLKTTSDMEFDREDVEFILGKFRHNGLINEYGLHYSLTSLAGAHVE